MLFSPLAFFSLLKPIPVAAGLFGVSDAQAALMMGGAGLLYSIHRLRKNILARRQKPRTAPAPLREPALNPLNVREITTEIQALLADVEDTSRRLSAQLDNRYTRLEQLLLEADARIRTLESLSGKPAPTSPFSPPPASPIAPPAEGATLTNAQRALSRLRQERGAPPAGEDPAYQPIYSLADRGKSPREIAQELGRQPGEIELILALRPHATT